MTPLREKKLRLLVGADLMAIEDGRLVLYHINRDLRSGYGVERVDRYPTSISSRDFDESLFPAKVEIDLGGHYIIFPHPVHGLQRVHVPSDVIEYDRAEGEVSVLPESELDPGELENRWRFLRSTLRDEGRLVVVHVTNRLPRKSREMFKDWAAALSSGAAEDEATDALYDKYGVDLANDFFRATRTPRAAFDAKSDAVFVLEGKKSMYAPLAHHGPLPDVDWTKVPR